MRILQNLNSRFFNKGFARLQQSHSGFSLVELMVAMLIGLFLLAGVTTMYIGNKATYAAREQLSLIEDNGRTALRDMVNIIEHTGYTSTLSVPLNQYFITGTVSNSTCNDGSNSIVDTSILGATSDDANGDTIGVIYLGDGAMLTRDCTGNQLPVSCSVGVSPILQASMIYNTFSVSKRTGDNMPVLKCAGSRHGSAIEIAEGIENLQISYGIDVNGDSLIDRYIDAGEVTSANAWNQVIGVQLAILVRSLKEVNEKATAQSYVLLDEKYDFNDRYQRAVFTTSVRLQNVTM
jgi:prepilin-type N-terminal cleavage/methylation domain-containing protein